MKNNEMLAIDGVFLAVKCAICETVYSAESDEYLAFFGSVTAGLDNVIMGVAPPRRPAKKALVAVCRTPGCMAALVRKMLGCDGERGDANELWTQALKIWADDAGHELVETKRSPAVELKPKAKLKAKARR